MHASFPCCYPHSIKYLAASEWNCSFAGSSAIRCIRDILSFFAIAASIYHPCMIMRNIFVSIRDNRMGEWLHIWVDYIIYEWITTMCLKDVQPTKTNPQNGTASAAVITLTVNSLSSYVKQGIVIVLSRKNLTVTTLFLMMIAFRTWEAKQSIEFIDSLFLL